MSYYVARLERGHWRPVSGWGLRSEWEPLAAIARRWARTASAGARLRVYSVELCPVNPDVVLYADRARGVVVWDLHEGLRADV